MQREPVLRRLDRIAGGRRADHRVDVSGATLQDVSDRRCVSGIRDLTTEDVRIAELARQRSEGVRHRE